MVPSGIYEDSTRSAVGQAAIIGALLPFVSTETGLLIPGETEGEGEGEEKETKQGKRARYECSGGCGTTMRGPSGRKLICGDCETPYIETGF
jgi:hypothetical protein